MNTQELLNVIKTNEDELPINVAIKVIEDKAPTLEYLQAWVGGLIEVVELPSGEQVIVNEEGLLLSLAPNFLLSMLTGKNVVGKGLVLVGDAKLK